MESPWIELKASILMHLPVPRAILEFSLALSIGKKEVQAYIEQPLQGIVYMFSHTSYLQAATPFSSAICVSCDTLLF